MDKHIYFLRMRPPGPGCQPTDGLIFQRDYGQKCWVAEANCRAWGEVHYNRELSEKEIHDYELAQEQKGESE